MNVAFVRTSRRAGGSDRAPVTTRREHSFCQRPFGSRTVVLWLRRTRHEGEKLE